MYLQTQGKNTDEFVGKIQQVPLLSDMGINEVILKLLKFSYSWSNLEYST